MTFHKRFAIFSIRFRCDVFPCNVLLESVLTQTCVCYLFLQQTETLSSLKALQKHIDQTQLTRELEGHFHYDHKHWIHFRQVGVTGAAGSCKHICKLA